MTELKLTPDLLTGLQLIDDQHREFFKRANAFMGAAEEPAGVKRASAAELYMFLRVYVVEHFSAEQKLMEQHAYPKAAAHLNAHGFFMAELDKLEPQPGVWAGTSSAFMRVSYLLTDWFVNHIRKTDRELVQFLLHAGDPRTPPPPAPS